MLPVIEGIIRRRILLNFRTDPEIIQPLLASPLKVLTTNGFSIIGICLIGMQNLRPKGFPAGVGLSSENMAHRVAIRYPAREGFKDGVFIWRRDTDQCLMALLGGRLFPGVQRRADFTIHEMDDGLSFTVSTADGSETSICKPVIRASGSRQRHFPTSSMPASFSNAAIAGFRAPCARGAWMACN
jgi:hypothetical protein